MSLIFQSLYKIIGKFRLISLIILLLLLGFLAFTASRLKLTEDISQVLPKSESIDNMSFVLSNSRFLDKVVFHFSLKDTLAEPEPEQLSRFADQLSDSLMGSCYPELLTSIDKAPDNQSMLELYGILNSYLPLLLDSADYQHMDSLISRDQIRKTLESNYSTLISPVGLATK